MKLSTLLVSKKHTKQNSEIFMGDSNINLLEENNVKNHLKILNEYRFSQHITLQ